MSQWSADALGRSAVRRALRPAVARCHALCPARMCVDRSRFAFHAWSFRRRLEVVGREILRRGGTFVAHGRLRTRCQSESRTHRSLSVVPAAARCYTLYGGCSTACHHAKQGSSTLTESFQGGQGPRSRACQLAREGEPKKSGHTRRCDVAIFVAALLLRLSCPCLPCPAACICLLPTSVLNNSQQAGASRLNSVPTLPTVLRDCKRDH